MPEQPVTIFSPPKSPPANPAPAQPEFRSTPVRDARQVAGTRSDPPMSEPQRRWKADYDQLTKENPWRDPNVLITKDEHGIIHTQPRGDAQHSTTPADARAQPGQPPQVQPGPATTDGTKLKVGQYELTETDIAGLMAEKAARDSRAANTPKDAASFTLDLPADFKLPEGIGEFRWSDDPVSTATLGQLKQWAHGHQLDQGAFSGLLALYASHQAAEQQKFAEAQRAEVAKLGAAAPTRVDAVNTWLRSMVGDQLAESLRKTLITADQIKAYETMISRWTSQGVGGNPAGSRDGADAGREPGRVSEEVYAKMSYTEKQQYAAQFDQSRHQR
jgi:hypothetical protein